MSKHLKDLPPIPPIIEQLAAAFGFVFIVAFGWVLLWLLAYWAI